MNQRTCRTPILFLLITFISVPLLAMDAPGYRKLVCGQSNPDLIPFQTLIALIKDIDSNEEKILKAINQNKHLCTVCDFANNTLLIEATKNGMLSVIKHIIIIGNELGLDSSTAVNHIAREGHYYHGSGTVLSIAVNKNYTGIIDFLLGPNLSKETIRNAIDIAERKNQSPENETMIALLKNFRKQRTLAFLVCLRRTDRTNILYRHRKELFSEHLLTSTPNASLRRKY